jgi:hypothetical protein
MTPYNPYYVKAVTVERQTEAAKARLVRELRRDRVTRGHLGRLAIWHRKPARSSSVFVPGTNPSA